MKSRPVVTAEDVTGVAAGGELRVEPGALVTPWALEMAASRGVRIVERTTPSSGLTIAMGSDHGGFALKDSLKAALGSQHRIRDAGTLSGTEACDYPDFAAAVARLVASGQCDFGIMIDSAGIGSCMAANKIRGARAAMCHDEAAARNAREHNDANVLTLGAKVVDASRAKEIALVFLSTRCIEPRHQRRVAKVMELERRG